MSKYSDNLQPTYEVRCAVCHNLTRTGHGEKQYAIRWLREQGWHNITRDWPYRGKIAQWVCPACLDHHPNTKEGRLL